MNIAQILPELKVGGVERGTVDLALALARRGHKAIVISGGGELVRELLEAGIKHYSLPVHKKEPLEILKMIGAVRRILLYENVELLHARSRVPAIIGFFAARRAGVKFITTAHGYYSAHFFSRVMGWGKFVIVASRAIARHMIEDFRVVRSRIRYIPRGVDLEAFKFSPRVFVHAGGRFRVGIIGRITPLKGHTYFIRAAAKFGRLVPASEFWIVGDVPPDKSPYGERLRRMVAAFGMNERIKFLGNRQDVPQVLGELDCVVMATTVPEAFGRGIIEAGAVGVPVVATRVGGIVDIIEDGQTGILVPPEDPDAIAGALKRLYDEPQLRERLSANMRKKVEGEYSSEKMISRTEAVYQEAISAERILVIKLGAVGDVILITPSLRAIREKFPHGHITVLVGFEAKDLLLKCPYIDELIVFEGRTKGNKWLTAKRKARTLRAIGFDIVIDLQNNRLSHLLSFLSSAPRRYGHDNGKWGILINNKARRNIPAINPLLHQLEVLRLLGINAVEGRLQLWPMERDEREAENILGQAWLGEKQILVGMNLGAGLRWQSKRWPIENFAALCNGLAERAIRVVLTGSKEELPLASEVLKLTSASPINAVGRTSLLALAALIRHCRAYVSSDSAPLHIACAMGVPAVALFGPTDPKRHVAMEGLCKVIRKDIPCSPCYKSSCRPLTCMREITVDEVAEAVINLAHSS